MNIAVKGSPERSEELSEILSSAGLVFTKVESTKNIHKGNYDVIFDLDFDDDQGSIDDYSLLDKSTLLLLSSVKIQLEAVLDSRLLGQSAGINAMSGFLNRSSLEYCCSNELFGEEMILKLGWKNGLKSASRVGLISPRIICMIINEAYFTVQEGTANINDIDLGMKLGTAYPKGPFEWCKQIGIKNVYETLSALYSDTHDERYKICSMLKTEYLKSQAK